MAQPRPVTDLMQALDFTPDDLATNHEGRLSERQRDRLRRQRRRSLLIGAALFIIFALVATGFLFVGQTNGSLIAALIGIGVTLCGAALLGTFARHWLRLGADLHVGQAHLVGGSVERVLRVNGRVTTYVIKVNDDQFQVSKETLKLFEHQAPYCLYCTLYTRLLLSAERMEG